MITRELDLASQDFVAYAEAHKSLSLVPVIVGPALDCVLLGAIISQVVWWYILDSSRESRIIRILVWYLLLVAVVHTCLSLALQANIFVSGYGDFAYLLDGRWFKRAYIMELFAAGPIECFYAHRAWSLWGRSRLMGVFLVCLLLLNISLGISVQLTTSSNFVHVASSPSVYAWCSSLVALDWILSCLIIVALSRAKSGFLHTDKIVKQLIVLAAEAQIIPSLVAMAFLIKSTVWPSSLMGNLFLPAPKVWIATCMVVVISRHGIRDKVEAERQRREITFDLGLQPRHFPTPADPHQSFQEFLVASRPSQPSTHRPSTPRPFMSMRYEDSELKGLGITARTPELDVTILNQLGKDGVLICDI